MKKGFKKDTKNDIKNLFIRNNLKYSLIFTFFITTMINTLLEIFREIFIITKQQPSSIYFIKLFLTFPLIFGFMLIVQKFLGKYSLSVI